MARKSRPSSFPTKRFLTPFNVKDFGDMDKDPCFGKHFDLLTDECQACGDNELCSIAFSVKVKDKMLLKEADDHNLDQIISDLELVKDIKDYLHKCSEKGLRKPLAISKAVKRFKVSKDYINNKIIQNGL